MAVLWLAAVLVLVAGLSGLVGCAAPDRTRTTRMTVGDLEEVAARIAASLGASEAIARRGPESQRWVIGTVPLLNLSTDIFTQAEKEWLPAKLRTSLPMLALGKERNLAFVAMPRRVLDERRRVVEEGETNIDPASLGRYRSTTHALVGEVRSVTRGTNRGDAAGRTDLYYVEFELIDLATNQTLWSGACEIKRRAGGSLWD